MEGRKTELIHIPVLKSEVIRFLEVKPGRKYIDTTVGGGGHAEAILKSGGELLGIDFDPEALRIAEKHLASACPPGGYRWRLAHGNFASLIEITQKNRFYPVDGVLFDLGVSSFQLGNLDRGFSFASKGSLDMRLAPEEQKVTAKDLVNVLNEGELYELFTRLGEERYSRRVAHAICVARRLKPIETAAELAVVVAKAVPYRGRRHPATKVFQALRIVVNDELNNLREALPQAMAILKKGGRLVVISFHSLEDRIVKEFLKEQATLGKMNILTKKPIIPIPEERRENPRSRSAKLRAAEKNET